ncbi:hypothetical protein TL16_g09774 [Triparma laevis f. inornata]|uniref:Uncharacterized protein n=2 Tax=Triparma laevis TaxID=1534972 RepID=A0A9W7E708_9STRA|nr:hypothetical protein TrLO_g5909 [Triparma laevis f. longispina]GMH83976.1 hypothetical protein TL16_g09774 [Triparma laevis f. inornata]
MTLPPPVELSHLLDSNIPEETRDLALQNALRIPPNPPQITPLNSLLPSVAGSQNDPLISAFITNFIQNPPVSMHPTDLFIMTLTAISISCPLSTFPSLKILIEKIVVGNTTTSATRIITSMSSALENAPLLEEINANANIKIDATSNKLRLLELISSTCFSQSLHPPTPTILSTLESLLTSSDLLSVPVTFEFIVSLAEEYKTR